MPTEYPEIDLIESTLSERRLRWADLARMLNESDQTMGNWKRRGLPASRMMDVASALEISLDDLAAARGRQRGKVGHPGWDQEAVTRPRRMAPAATPGVPVVGRVQAGADGFWTDSQFAPGSGDGLIEVPTSDRNAYALRVTGDSMSPALRPGWYIVVEPNGVPQPGEYVVVRLKDGRKMVKELLYHRAKQWTLASVNADFERLVFEDEEVESVHPVSYYVPPSKLKI